MLHCSLYKIPWPNIKERKSLSSKWKPDDVVAGRGTPAHDRLFRTLFVDSSKLPPAKGAKRPPTKRKSSLSFLKNDRPRIFNSATTRSVPTTPPLGISTAPTRSKSALPPTSAPVQPDPKLARLEALRVPFIHLLAIRPVSEKFLAQTTGASVEECSGLLQKVGRPWRLDASKWELSDRAYKTLDIWKFHYASTDDRQMAIDNTVKAFDRQRLSRTDKVWDSLLPVKERNKGTCLSRLNLHSGFIQRSSTPRINVQQHKEEGTVSATSTSNESDSRNGALVPHGGEAMVRSRSQDPIKKTKISEREAQSKRLLSKDPKRATLASKAKERKPAPKKDASTTNPRVKSAEFVRDSDEESSPMEGVVLTGGRSQPQRPAQEAKPAGSVIVPPRKRTNSTVPQKPSPLGCSPPTNASDFENEVGSSSYTTTAATASTAATITSTTAAPSTTTTTTTTQRSQGPPLKRKADALGGNAESVTNKRHQASSPAITPQSSESSGGSRTPSQEVLLLARRFKSYYAKYERLYREVATSPSPPPEQVKKVMDMHNRLAAMKAEIERGAA